MIYNYYNIKNNIPMRFFYYIHMLLIAFSVGVFASEDTEKTRLTIPSSIETTSILQHTRLHQDTRIDIKIVSSVGGSQDNPPKSRKREFTISFPSSGEQPSTEDAVRYSCANIDSKDITEWYMKMFGWTKYEDETPLKYGYGSSGDVVSIITMDDNMLGNEQAFWKELKKIASNPVGRVLLYRLLIEIWRTDSKENGCMERKTKKESPEAAEDPLNERNLYRHITIKWSDSGNCFICDDNKKEAVIEFGTQSPPRKMTSVGTDQERNYRTIVLHERPDDVGLFHEMLHWYHCLRRIRRYTTDALADNGKVKLNGHKKDDNASCIDIGRYYWDIDHGNNAENADNSEKWKVSAQPWLAYGNFGNEEYYTVNFEEIRTILGSHPDVADYINGDDLSENLYRATRNCCMRFGHTNTPYYEDEIIIKRAADVCKTNGIYYRGYKLKYVPINGLSRQDRPSLLYHKIRQIGVGACKIRAFRLELIRP